MLGDGALQSESGGAIVCESEGVRGRGSGAAGGSMPDLASARQEGEVAPQGGACQDLASARQEGEVAPGGAYPDLASARPEAEEGIELAV